MLSFTEKFDKWVKNFCYVQLNAAAVALTAIVLLNIWEISVRYLMHKSFLGAQEITILLFDWSVFLGFGAVTYKGSDIVVTILRDRLPCKIQNAVILITDITAVLFSISLAILGGMLMGQQMHQRSVIIGFNVALFTLPMVICGVTLATIYANRVLKWFCNSELTVAAQTEGGSSK
ncbi:MAG TPA: TRAP transporter small permease [Firmicutes bacterium]|nr:TRAP transporter small permease [Bacillota bacterium]